MNYETPIVIMTYGRAKLEKQLTWNSMPVPLRKNVVFVVRPEEEEFFANLASTLVLPKSCTTMKETRQVTWDYFNENFDYWFQIDDDTKKFLELVSHDPTKKPIQRLKFIGDDEGLFNACLTLMKTDSTIGTCSPRQTFKPPPLRLPKCGFTSAELCIGFNCFRSSTNKALNYRFQSSSNGDTEMVFKMLSAGLDTVWLQNYTIDQNRPTKGAELRKEARTEWQRFTEEYPKYVTKIRDVESEFPQKGWRMARSKLLKDARQ